jgi:hypothetical protein
MTVIKSRSRNLVIFWYAGRRGEKNRTLQRCEPKRPETSSFEIVQAKQRNVAFFSGLAFALPFIARYTSSPFIVDPTDFLHGFFLLSAFSHPLLERSFQDNKIIKTKTFKTLNNRQNLAVDQNDGKLGTVVGSTSPTSSDCSNSKNCIVFSVNCLKLLTY